MAPALCCCSTALAPAMVIMTLVTMAPASTWAARALVTSTTALVTSTTALVTSTWEARALVTSTTALVTLTWEARALATSTWEARALVTTAPALTWAALPTTLQRPCCCSTALAPALSPQRVMLMPTAQLSAVNTQLIFLRDSLAHKCSVMVVIVDCEDSLRMTWAAPAMVITALVTMAPGSTWAARALVTSTTALVTMAPALVTMAPGSTWEARALATSTWAARALVTTAPALTWAALPTTLQRPC